MKYFFALVMVCLCLVAPVVAIEDSTDIPDEISEVIETAINDAILDARYAEEPILKYLDPYYYLYQSRHLDVSQLQWFDSLLNDGDIKRVLLV